MSVPKKQATALHRLLMRYFPSAFPSTYNALLPLKLGIEADILAQLEKRGERVDPSILRRVLANHTGRAGYLLALIHRRDRQRFDLEGHPAGEISALAQVEAEKQLATHQQRQHAASVRRKQHRALEKAQQATKATRIAEQARRAAEKQHRREENERNRLKKLAHQLSQGREETRASPLTVTYRKRRRIKPPDT